MSCDKIRKILVEREESISPNWFKVLKTLNVESNESVDVETFMKIYKMFRLEIA